MDKNKMTRYIILVVLLCLIAVGTAFLVIKAPAEPFVIDTYVESVVEDKKTIGYEVAEYIGEDKNLTVPLEVGGHDVTGIKAGAFADMTDVESIMIKNNITYVGPGAFSGWTETQTIMIEEGTDMSGWDVDWMAGCGAVVMDEVAIAR